MVKVAPSILSADFSRLGKEVKRIQECGADLLHMDVMDGCYVPNISIGFPVLQAAGKIASIPMDIHLMIKEADKLFEKFLELKPEMICFHLPNTKNPEKLFQKANEKGVKAGLAFNLNESIEPGLKFLDKVDFVLVLSVNAGFSGQEFTPSALEKVRALKKFREENGLKFEIELDGGVNEENAPLAVEAGADILVSGSTVFNSKDAKKTIEFFKSL